SGPARVDSGSAGWCLRRCQNPQTAAWSKGGCGAWWNECRACKEVRQGNRGRGQGPSWANPLWCTACESDDRKSWRIRLAARGFVPELAEQYFSPKPVLWRKARDSRKKPLTAARSVWILCAVRSCASLPRTAPGNDTNCLRIPCYAKGKEGASVALLQTGIR